MCKVKDIEEYFETASSNIIELRARALDEQITPQELAACLINICNKRGYKPFYDASNDMSKKDAEEVKYNQEEIDRVKLKLQSNNYRTVAEMIYKDESFQVVNSEFKKYRNSKYREDMNVFSRDMMEDEAKKILEKQSEYYPQLTNNNIDIIIDIIFSQRDFEDGPGDKDDKYRKYKGFLDSLGNCTFYKNEKRGSRFTLLSDIFSYVNTLSQLIYINTDTGEFGLSSELAKALVEFALESEKVNITEIKKIVKKYGFELAGHTEAKFEDCFKFSKALRPKFEKFGYNWKELSDDFINENSLLNRIGIFLSENITPSRRERKYKEDELFSELKPELIKKLLEIKTTGTTNACYRFMRESIEAFLDGQSYGSFQTEAKKNIENKLITPKYKILPAFDNSCEFADNPVVFRAINETRKIVNAVIRKYGSPYAINIEIGSELNSSFKQRNKIQKIQNQNEKNTQRVIKQISELCNIAESEVKPSMIERYKLAEEQEWKCLYSGKAFTDKKEVCLNKNRSFEVDHIVPFSLILDNTLKNKALVYYKENQAKGQRTPLMYLKDDGKAKDFIGTVNRLYGKKKEHKIKYKYLMLKNLYDTNLLNEWKSRNINDTRYISDFLVNYFKNTLEFYNDEDEKYARQPVYAVKSAITSKLRRQWLDEERWGIKDKKILKEQTCLDHAVDAIVIANCIPVYVEITALNQKLRDIYYSAGKVETDEYRKTRDDAIENLWKYYGVSKDILRKQLTSKITPSFIPRLYEEVNIRVCDCDMVRYFRKDNTITDDEIKEFYRKKVSEFYAYDPEFAALLHMPLVSIKQDKKINKGLFGDNPLSVKEIDGQRYEIKTKNILEIKKSDISNIYTNDRRLIEKLNCIMADCSAEDKLGDVIGQDQFKYNGRPIYKIKVKDKTNSTYFTKEISENNYSIMNDAKYYCIEIYETIKGKVNMRGIKRSNLVIKNGKLFLSKIHQYPEDYSKFIMYLYPGDYIKIIDDKKETEGYYTSVKNVNSNSIYMKLYSNSKSVVKTITQNSKIIKYDIDILGNKRGEIRCGEPLSLITEKNF